MDYNPTLIYLPDDKVKAAMEYISKAMELLISLDNPSPKIERQIKKLQSANSVLNYVK